MANLKPLVVTAGMGAVTRPNDLRDHQASFDLLTRDTMEILEYVEPVDSNASTYSQPIYGVILRPCTDFESLARDLLVAAGETKPREKMNVLDYRKLEPQLHLQSVEVHFLPWRPNPLAKTPFRDWSTREPPLAWYATYNAVKHDRGLNFTRATLDVLMEALAGQFALLARACDCSNWNDYSWSDEGGGNFLFMRQPFVMYWKDTETKIAAATGNKEPSR